MYSTRTTVFPHAVQQLQDISTYRINSSTRILQEILQLQGSSRAGSFQQLFPVSPSILSGSQHPRSPYNSSQDTPKTTCPRTIQGYKSSPGHSPKTTHSRNTGQDSPKTNRPRTTPGRTFQDNSSHDISTRYMVFQDNWSQDRNRYTTCPETHQ